MTTLLQYVRIPCSHQQNSSLHPCDHVKIKIECRFRLKEFERLITYCVDDDGQHSNIPITPYRLTGNNIVTDPFNPFCDQCHSYNINLIKSWGHNEECAEIFLRGVKDFVRNEISLFKEVGCTEFPRYVWNFTNHIDRVCRNADVLMAWVERASFEEEVAKPTPTTKVSIEALPRSIIKNYESTNNCMVCLEELYDNKKQGALKVTMPCKHEFHEDCIVEWLHTSHFCPLCRFELPTEVDED